MPMLRLDRRVELIEDEGPPAVVCEPKTRISGGTCVRLSIDPERPYRHWLRTPLEAEPRAHPDRPPVKVLLYDALEPGIYEAHSTFRSGEAVVAYVRVAAAGAIELLGHAGDEDAVLAALHGLPVDELIAARRAAGAVEGRPEMAGTARQVAWAESIRDTLTAAARAAGDEQLAAGLETVTDATWFLANRDRSPSELRERLPVPAGRRPPPGAVARGTAAPRP
jgi:hypothetical protein